MTDVGAAWRRAGLVAGLVVALDQVVKAAVVATLERGESVALFPGLSLTHVRNTGVAFGALAGAGALVAVLAVLSLVALIAFFSRHAERPWLWLPVGMLIGGAFGNLADRAREGSVIDFIDPVAWPSFNVADSAIVIGVGALFLLVDRRPAGVG